MYPYNLESNNDPNDIPDLMAENFLKFEKQQRPEHLGPQPSPPMGTPPRPGFDQRPGTGYDPRQGPGGMPIPDYDRHPGTGHPPGQRPGGMPIPGYDPHPDPGHPPDHRPSGTERPLGAPPDRIPEKRSSSVYAVDPGAIRGCLYNYAYVWLHNGVSFWLYPTFVGRKSVSGYRWSRFGWVYTGLDLDMIDTFICKPY